MKVKLFQIAPEKDRYNLMFMNYEFTMEHGGIRESTYELVFDGELDVKRLDNIFYIFNCELPFSHFETVCLTTFSLAASSSCVIPFFLRSAFRLS